MAPAAGIDFTMAGEVHDGTFVDVNWPSFPEIMGGGACWFDFDGDGYDDLYLVTQAYNDENPYVGDWVASADPHNKLYRNRGDSTFEDVSAAAGVDSRGFGYGCSAADYDGDGWVDLFATNFGDNLLFRNQGDGTFSNVSAAAGVELGATCQGDHPCMSASSAWADYDNDGDLDLHVDNYVDTNLTDPARGPNRHDAQFNFLHRNNGDGTFTEVAHSAGVAGQDTDEDGSKSLGVVWLDADLDGDLDLFVTNDETPDDFYVNNGDGTFLDRSAEAGVDDPLAGMGVTSGDYDADGLPDLFFTHYQGEHNGFYRNNGDGTFEKRNGEEGLDSALDYVGWGTKFTDWDRDGDLDIIAVNGHTEAAIANAHGDPWYNEPRLVWRNDPNLDALADPWDRNWTDVTLGSGSGMNNARVSRGAAFGDFDLDGNLDVAVVNNANQTAELLQGTGVVDSWLYVSLRQPGMNRHAVGARILLEAGGATQVREVQTGTSYLSQNTLAVDFGLGSHVRADRVTVQWPGGGTTVVEDVPGNRVIRIDRATGTYVDDTLSPLTQALVQGEGQDGWWRTPLQVQLNPQDRGVHTQSGVASTEYALDDMPWQPYTGGQSFFFDEERDHRLRMRSADNAGNQEPVRTERFRIDLTQPTPSASLDGTLGQEGWYVNPVTMTLGGSDARSGVGAIRYRLDAGDWQDYTGPVTFGDEGVHAVDYVVADIAGNEAAVGRVEFRIDNVAPDVALLDPRAGGVYVAGRMLAELGKGPAMVTASEDPLGAGVASVMFHVRAAAADASSGVAMVTFQVNGQVVATDRAGPEYAFEWPVGTSATGLYEVTAIASDRAGNVRADTVLVVVVGATVGGLERTIGQGPSLPPSLGP